MKQILKLSQPNCVPCATVGKFLDSQDVEYIEVDIQEQPEYVDMYGIMGVPVTILLDEDKEVERVIGYNPTAIQNLIDQL